MNNQGWFPLELPGFISLLSKGLSGVLSSTTPQKHQIFGAWVSSDQSFRHVWLFTTPWTATCQASLSITKSQSLLRLMSTESVMSHNHLILCRPFLLPPSIFPNIRVFSKQLDVHIRFPKYWSFSNHQSFPRIFQDWSPLGLTGFISLLSKGLSRVFSNTTVQKHQFFGAQLSL